MPTYMNLPWLLLTYSALGDSMICSVLQYQALELFDVIESESITRCPLWLHLAAVAV